MEAMEVDIVEKIVASHLMRTILSSSERMAWSTCHPLVRCCSMKLILTSGSPLQTGNGKISRVG